MPGVRSLLILVLAVALFPGMATAEGELKVRTITAFLPLDPLRADVSFQQAADFLQEARRRVRESGLEVQTLRIATRPLAGYLPRMILAQRRDTLLRWDRWAEQNGLQLSLGPAVVAGEPGSANPTFVVELLQRSRVLSTSVVIADSRGPHREALSAAAQIIRALGQVRAANPPAFRFAALAVCPPQIPFFPAAYASGDGRSFAFGLESAGVVAQAVNGEEERDVKRIRFQAALQGPLQALESVGVALARETGWSYAGIDVSPSPGRASSIGAAVEALSGEPLGSAGSLAAVATLTTWIRDLPVRKTGFSGLMLPVLEDPILARRASEGRLNLQLLLTYSAVSATGLDTVPIPGDTSAEEIERVLADVAALAVKLQKPLAARLLPVAGKRAGESTEFDSPFLINARVLRVE